QLSVLYLKNLGRLSDRHSRHRRWHVEQSPFVEWRHELLAEPRVRENCEKEQQKCTEQNKPAKTQNKIQGRFVNRNQEPIDRILFFQRDLPPDQQGHQNRRERDREDRS